MHALSFWKAVTMDRAGFLEDLIAALNQSGIRYCVIGGQAVNAYAEPLVSLDLDLAVAVKDLERVQRVLEERFHVETFPHSMNISSVGSQLRVQIQTDPRYAAFVAGASEREILGLVLPVASAQDVLQGKIWAAIDSRRGPGKRRKDLLDIERLVEALPELRSHLPEEIAKRLSDSAL